MSEGPGRMPRRAWVAGVAALLCVLLAGVVWAAGREDSPSASPTPQASAPASSPSASGRASPGPTPTGPACQAALVVTNQWDGGYQSDVTVTANAPLESWSVTLTLESAAVTGSWNSTLPIGATGTAKAGNVDYNGTLAAGGTTAFGF